MPQATNLISIDDSMQAEALGSACLVAIIGTINILLIVLDRTIQKTGKKDRRSLLSTKHIQQKQCTLQSLKVKYGYLFRKVYIMDFEVFHRLHELLKHGISEYIQNDQIHQSNGGKCFHYHNGEITTEIHLACALQIFAGGSFLS